MGGWVGNIYYLFITYILYLKFELFLINYFGLPNFLSNLISQKNHFMVSQKTHESSWMCSNQLV
jgi:hypothetical protein